MSQPSLDLALHMLADLILVPHETVSGFAKTLLLFLFNGNLVNKLGADSNLLIQLIQLFLFFFEEFFITY